MRGECSNILSNLSLVTLKSNHSLICTSDSGNVIALALYNMLNDTGLEIFEPYYKESVLDELEKEILERIQKSSIVEQKVYSERK